MSAVDASYVTPTHRHAGSGEPVLATQLPDGDVLGGRALAASWLVRWVDALGGVATTDGTTVRVTVGGGYLTVQPGQWLVYDFRRFIALDDDAFGRDYVTDLVPMEPTP